MPYYIGDVIKDEKRLIARTPEKFRETGVDVRLEVRVEEIDRDKKTVRLSDRTTVPYDILVLGTGTTAFVPKAPGVELEGVFVLKTLSDAIRIKTYLREKQCRKAIIVGAQSFKVFSLGAAAAGIDETEAKNSGYHPVSTIIWGNAIARSMPGEKRLGIKLVADRATGMLLGAQAVGTIGAVERINTLSCALWAGVGLDEIAYLDFAYSPLFSPAWDPIHIAAQELMKKI